MWCCKQLPTQRRVTQNDPFHFFCYLKIITLFSVLIQGFFWSISYFLLFSVAHWHKNEFFFCALLLSSHQNITPMISQVCSNSNIAARTRPRFSSPFKCVSRSSNSFSAPQRVSLRWIPPTPPAKRKRILSRASQVIIARPICLSACKLIVVSGNDADLCIQSHSHHSHAITAVSFFGNLLVTGSLDGSVSLINIHFSEVVDRISVPVKCGGVTCVSASVAEAATGTFIAGTGSGRLIKVSFFDSTVSCSLHRHNLFLLQLQELRVAFHTITRLLTAKHTLRLSRAWMRPH